MLGSHCPARSALSDEVLNQSCVGLSQGVWISWCCSKKTRNLTSLLDYQTDWLFIFLLHERSGCVQEYTSITVILFDYLFKVPWTMSPRLLSGYDWICEYSLTLQLFPLWFHTEWFFFCANYEAFKCLNREYVQYINHWCRLYFNILMLIFCYHHHIIVLEHLHIADMKGGDITIVII